MFNRIMRDDHMRNMAVKVTSDGSSTSTVRSTRLSEATAGQETHDKKRRSSAYINRVSIAEGNYTSESNRGTQTFVGPLIIPTPRHHGQAGTSIQSRINDNQDDNNEQAKAKTRQNRASQIFLNTERDRFKSTTPEARSRYNSITPQLQRRDTVADINSGRFSVGNIWNEEEEDTGKEKHRRSVRYADMGSLLDEKSAEKSRIFEDKKDNNPLRLGKTDVKKTKNVWEKDLETDTSIKYDHFEEDSTSVMPESSKIKHVVNPAIKVTMLNDKKEPVPIEWKHGTGLKLTGKRSVSWRKEGNVIIVRPSM